MANQYRFSSSGVWTLIGGLLWSQIALAQPPSLVWQKTLGGSDLDQAYAITATGDGGFVVAGDTPSNDGDVSGNHGNSDTWVVKLNAAGQKVWQKALGGSGLDQAKAITDSGDGGVVVAGYTESNDGNVSGNHGNGDMWVVKLNAAGQIVWQKALGGSGQDYALAITASEDGGYVMAGYTSSNDGDVSGNHGGGDYWVIKLDKDGKKVWQKTLGGSSVDQARAITASEDGGVVVGGNTYSNDGDVSGHHGGPDYWVVKLDVNGSKVWQKTLGGSSDDVAQGITASGDGGVVVAGYTSSTDGDVIESKGFYDYWVVKLDANGSKVWQKTLGGFNSDTPQAITTSIDGGLVVAGTSNFTNGDVTGYQGGESDYWVVKLSSTIPVVTNLSASPSPVCAGQSVQFTATVGNVTGSYSYTLTNGADINQTGSSVASAFSRSVNASGQDAQKFTLRVEASNGVGSAKVFLTVNALPNAGFSGLTSTYCDNAGATTLTPTTSGGTFSGPGVSGTTFTLAQAGPGGTITYSVTVNGCTNSSSQNVTVTPTPEASFSGLAAIYCANSAAVTLTPATTGGTFSGPGVSGTTFTPDQAGSGGTITYSVTVNGCTNSSSQNVTVAPLPVASLTNNGPIADANPTVTLTASGGTSYAFSAGTTPSGTGTVTVTNPGAYQVTVTSQSCSAIASTTVTGAQNPATICRNGTAVIKVVASGNPAKYEWYKNTLNSPRMAEITNLQRGTATSSLTLTNQQVTANYYVRVTDQNGTAVVYGPFKVTVNMGCITSLGRLAAEEVELKITLLGNPLVGEQLRATVSGASGKALNMQLLDLSGRPVRAQRWDQAESEQRIEWNLGGQASGVYLLQAVTDGDNILPAQQRSLKVIKP